MIRRSVVALALAASLVTTSSYAQTAPSDAAPSSENKTADAKEAELRFQRARQLFDEGDYALALVEFKRAYDLSPNYRVLFNIAQINIQLLNYAAARVALERFLHDGGGDIAAPRKAQAESDLQMLRTRTAHLTLKAAPPADVSIDDVPLGTTPFPAPLLVNAGQRKIVVSRSGYLPFVKVVTLAGGDTQDLVIELTPVPVEERPEGPTIITKRTKNYTPAAIGWVATGVFGIGTAVFGGLYLSKQAEIEDLSDPTQNVSPQTKKEVEASATRLSVTADIFGVLTVGAAAAALYFTLKPLHTETVTTGKIRVLPTPTGVMGTF